jgi:hypothetical protein
LPVVGEGFARLPVEIYHSHLGALTMGMSLSTQAHGQFKSK